MKFLEGNFFPDFITLLKSWGSMIRSFLVNRYCPLTTSFRNSRLNSQPLSSLHSPSLQDISTAPGAHSFQKSVGSLPFDIAWLIGPFHRSPLMCFRFVCFLK